MLIVVLIGRRKKQIRKGLSAVITVIKDALSV